MSFAWLYPLRVAGPFVLLSVAFAVSPLGCGDITSTPDDDDDGSVHDVTLEFTNAGTLELRPKEVKTLSLQTDPGAKVTLLLLGDALDASLNNAIAKADTHGLASVQITAPSKPTTFLVRAQVGDAASAELHVAVSEQGFATLAITPRYAGTRTLETWSADVLVGGSCDAILANYPEDPIGALHVDADASAGLSIGSVPVGPQLAVAVRSGSLASGCVSFTATKPEGFEDVTVTIIDRAVGLEDAELDVALDYTPTSPEAYGDLVLGGGLAVADAAFPPEAYLSSLLLDAMASSLGVDASASITTLREQSSLDAQVMTALEGADPHGFCVELAQSGAGIAIDDVVIPDTAKIKGRLRGVDGQPAVASFELTSFIDLPAESIGAANQLEFSWSVGVSDLLVVSGVLPVSASRLGGAYMSEALFAQLGTATVSDELAATMNCPAVASTILATGEVAGCDQACLETACFDAVATRWSLGVASGESEDGPLGSLQIAVSGNVSVSDDLLPVELSGTWLGTMAAVGYESMVSGAATGHAPPPR